jgi:ubiquinone biosynthesis protein
VDCPTIFKHYTTSNVLMMSYMGGIDIDETDRLVEEGYDLQEIAVKLVENYIKQIVDDAFFQADPHPGNIRIHDGKIGWIDLGMMGTLSRRDCELFREAISAVAAKDISAIKTVVLSLGDHTGKIDHTRLYADLSDLMDEYGSVNIGEMSLSEFLQDLLHICNVNHIQMPQGVTMLVRGVMTIESVVAKLDPSASIVSVMQQHILEPSLQDLDLKVTAKKLTRSLISAGTHTLELPENLNNLSKEALKGHSKFNLEIVGSEEPIKQLGKMVNRLVLAVITAALLLASSFLAITDMKPQILGIPALAFFGYLGALILGGGTLYSVYRSWRKKKKRRPFFFPK